MLMSTYSRALRIACLAARRVFLAVVFLPALLLGCDSFSTGPSGLSLTPDVESISPSDSTVTLTLRNDSPSPVTTDFFCRTLLQKKVNGRWEDREGTNPFCFRALSVVDTSAATSKLSYVLPPPVAPGESRQAEVNIRKDLGDATAIRFHVWIEYQKRPSHTARRGDARYDGSEYLISEEIRVVR
jgi:hypothetical protein